MLVANSKVDNAINILVSCRVRLCWNSWSLNYHFIPSWTKFLTISVVQLSSHNEAKEMLRQLLHWFSFGKHSLQKQIHLKCASNLSVSEGWSWINLPTFHQDFFFAVLLSPVLDGFEWLLSSHDTVLAVIKSRRHQLNPTRKLGKIGNAENRTRGSWDRKPVC